MCDGCLWCRVRCVGVRGRVVGFACVHFACCVVWGRHGVGGGAVGVAGGGVVGRVWWYCFVALSGCLVVVAVVVGFVVAVVGRCIG